MEAIKWFLYKLLVKFIGQPKSNTPIHVPSHIKPTKPYHWIFCSTIGELNGCKPLISKIAETGQLVLITDRDCYQKTFNTQFPNAIVIQIQGWMGESKYLADQFPPEQLILCEIPMLPYDAPCRLSYDFLRYLKKLKSPVYTVNGWLYEYGPSCRQDDIERKLFTKHYLATFDLMMVQNKSIKEKLIAAGQSPDRIEITGNMKFDAVKGIQLSHKNSEAKQIHDQILSWDKVTIVAGSLSEEKEYALVIDAFCDFRIKHQASLLIIAPRHPEKPEQILQIRKILESKKLRYVCRSEINAELSDQLDAIVLDTFGELQGMYHACDMAYIGKNHNVLEPLAFSKPVIILSGWEATYPSYPVYQICRDSGLLIELNSPAELAETFDDVTKMDAIAFTEKTQETLATLATALDKNCLLLKIPSNRG